MNILLLVNTIFGVCRLINSQTTYTYTIARKDIIPIVETLSKIAACNNTDTTTNVWTFRLSGTASCKLSSLLHNVSTINFKDTPMQKPGDIFILGPEQMTNKTEQERLLRQKKDRANYIATIIVAVLVSTIIAALIGWGLYEYIKTLRQSDSYVVRNPGYEYGEEDTNCSYPSPGIKRR